MNLGAGEIFAIVCIALLIFGPDKIPEIARALARGYRELTKLRQQMDSTLDDVKRDLKLDPELLDPLAERQPRPAASSPAGLIRAPQGERATARAATIAQPAAAPAAPPDGERFLFQALPVPAEDDYLTAAAAAVQPPAAAVAGSAGPLDPEDYLGSGQ